MDTEQTILDAMRKAGKPVRPGDIAEMTGLDKVEVSRVVDSLKKKGKITSPKRCFYTPAE